eukprot:5249174-Amphidinium_carterae.1
MTWGQGKSAQLMGQLLSMMMDGQPKQWQQRNKPQKKENTKPKRGEFGDGWNCSSCGFYNFGGRTKCFKCKTTPPPGQVGGGAPPPGQAGGKGKGSGKGGAGKSPTLTQARPRPEQMLSQQLSKTIEAPVKEVLQDALEKVKQAKFQSLSLRDQRATLLARAKQLAEKVDRMCEAVEKA